mmetsp:Transcript_1143/g.2697  ORF Transcript_1143/g.2697 Transcript_1143/m.2697 type:complete len:561 (+) Transcript_1143:16-1698(+)
MDNLKKRSPSANNSTINNDSNRSLNFGNVDGNEGNHNRLPRPAPIDPEGSFSQGKDRHARMKHRDRRNKGKPSTSLWKYWFGALGLCVVWFLLLSELAVDPDLDSRYYISSAKTGGNLSAIRRSLTLHHPDKTASSVRHGSRELFKNVQRSLKVSRKVLHHPTYLPQRARSIGAYFDSPKASFAHDIEVIDPNLLRMPSLRKAPFVGFPDTPEGVEAQKHLQNSVDYDWGRKDEWESSTCDAQYKWQNDLITTCNLVMEQDLTIVEVDDDSHLWPVRFLANGFWRDVWRVRRDLHDDEYGGRAVLKTMRYKHDYNPRNYDRHRRDAMAMERLTSSEYIMNIYAFCGNSGLFEFANGGSIEDSVYDPKELENWTPKEKLVVAHQAASGIAAMHNVDKEGVPSMVHADITASQFVYVEQRDIYKLNDFNRARFIAKHKETGKPCPFSIGMNPGTFRAPEEYGSPPIETEKIDVYSLGNVMYGLLTGLYPFDDMSDDEGVQKKIIGGERPPVPEDVFNSQEPFTLALTKAMEMCWRHNPRKRASAREVQHFLEEQLDSLGVGG